MSKLALKEEIELRIKAKISPEELQVIDESEAHIGHAGSREHGGAHFRIIAKSKSFNGMNHVQRHRLINELLSDLLDSNVIHALALKLDPSN
ncbi:BolA family transcriptional regulator [bacterium]|nr:BolA family transcriptional regulator [bacterium]